VVTGSPAQRSAREWLEIACWVVVAALAVTYVFTAWEPALYVGAALLLANAVSRNWPSYREQRKPKDPR